MVDKREMEQAQLFETADERGCTPMFGAAHRRASAVPYPRRYEVCSLFIASDPHTAQSCTGETPVPRWLRGMAVPAMIQNLTDLGTLCPPSGPGFCRETQGITQAREEPGERI